jgi:transmembrane sensor
LAAAVILTIGIFGNWQLDRPQPLRAISQLDSVVAETREATLPDGSGLTLGARSTVAIDFKGAPRKVELREGEAFFTVKHDKARPFVVHAGGLDVVAVGTAFDVLRTGSRVAVTVQEGTVEVSIHEPGGNAAIERLRASAGHQVVYDDAAQYIGPSLRVVDPVAATAWRQGRLEYIEEPLSSVIANLNRYSSRRITLHGVNISRLAYTGTIEARSIDEWLQALPRIFPVRVEAGPDNQISIQYGPLGTTP